MERNTPQKRAVMTALTQLEGTHPTADSVYEAVKTLMPEISRATVYRILNQITERGGLFKVRFQPVADRFDNRLDRHQHMLCLCCGEVVDVDIEIPDIETMYTRIPTDARYKINGHDLTFTGYCEGCAQHTLYE